MTAERSQKRYMVYHTKGTSSQTFVTVIWAYSAAEAFEVVRQSGGTPLCCK